MDVQVVIKLCFICKREVNVVPSTARNKLGPVLCLVLYRTANANKTQTNNTLLLADLHLTINIFALVLKDIVRLI
jgi:hypothetical protein